MCLRYIPFISAPFRSGVSCRSSADPTLHFAFISSIPLSTARLREILISISQAHSFRFPQALFQRTSNGIYFFCDELAPIGLIPCGRAEKEMFNLDYNWRQAENNFLEFIFLLNKSYFPSFRVLAANLKVLADIQFCFSYYRRKNEKNFFRARWNGPKSFFPFSECWVQIFNRY